MKIGYELELTTRYVDIISNKGQIEKGSFHIYINDKQVIVGLGTNLISSFGGWIGRKNGHSANFVLKFNDSKNMISVNKSYRFIFHNIKHYNSIKGRLVHYGYISSTDTQLKFTDGIKFK